MTEWIAILLLLLFGLLLMIVEIIFIPGTTIFGILGFIAALIGIYISFRQLGTQTGMVVLVGFTSITIVALYVSFKSKVWQRFALTSTISSRVNDDKRFLLRVGDEGKTISALRPSGKAAFKSGEAEVHSLGTFIDAGCLIKVCRLEDNKIFVTLV
ncbi:MAG: hypothetical protein V4714_05665 [Bacteroidota bacterium]